MEIKPTGADGIPFRPADNTGDAGKAKPFSRAVSETSAAETSPGLEALRGASKADLRTPESADAVVHRCLDELLEAAGKQFNRPMSDQEKQYLAGFLASDPVMRGKVRGYLEQVLK